MKFTAAAAANGSIIAPGGRKSSDERWSMLKTGGLTCGTPATSERDCSR